MTAPWKPSLTPLVPEAWKKVSRQAPDLKKIKAERQWQSESYFGVGVLELCQQADIVFLALHGSCGEDGRVQATLEAFGIPFTGANYLSSAIAMDSEFRPNAWSLPWASTPPSGSGSPTPRGTSPPW